MRLQRRVHVLQGKRRLPTALNPAARITAVPPKLITISGSEHSDVSARCRFKTLFCLFRNSFSASSSVDDVRDGKHSRPKGRRYCYGDGFVFEILSDYLVRVENPQAERKQPTVDRRTNGEVYLFFVDFARNFSRYNGYVQRPL